MPQIVTLPADSPLYLKGDRADRVFHIMRGAACEQYEEGMVCLDTPADAGECCGVTELLSGTPRLGRALTTAPSQLAIYVADEFLQIVVHDAALLDRVLKREIAILQQLNRMAKQYMGGGGEEASSGDESFYAMGTYFAAMKRPLQALYVFRRYGELFPDGAQAERAARKAAELGVSVEAQGDGLTGEELLDKAQAREQAGDFAAAAELYKKALTGTLTPVLKISVTLRQANALQMAGKPLLALKAIKLAGALEGLTVDDQNQARFLEGRCYELMQDPKKAALLYAQCDSGIWQQLAQARLAEMGR